MRGARTKRHGYEGWLLHIPDDPRPGRPSTAWAMMQGREALGIGADEIHDKTHKDTLFSSPGLQDICAEDINGFGWLRHFSSAEHKEIRGEARGLVSTWLATPRRHVRGAHTPEATARRIISWLTNGNLLIEEADSGLQRAVRRRLLRDGRRLYWRAWRAPDGAPRITTALALALMGVCLSGHERRAAYGFNVLERELHAQILPDGGHVSRDPSTHLAILFDLLTLQGTLSALGRPGPVALRRAIDRMLPMVRFFRHGDGGMALFNGAMEEDREAAQAALAHDESRGNPFGFAPHSGYQRLSAKRTLVLTDTGAPPAARYSRHAHAGCLSLEMSAGAQRVIVNCGAGRAHGPDWERALRATAAHSTLTLHNTSSARLAGRKGGVVDGPVRVENRRKENSDGIWLDAAHDGYLGSFGLIHRRRLFLSAGGDELRGEDRLERPHRRRWTLSRQKRGSTSFDVRFHLHPDVRAARARSGASVLVRLRNGEGWRLVARVQGKNAELSTQDSVYLGAGGRPRRAQQIVIHADASLKQARVNWLWKRVSKPARRASHT